MAAMGYAKPPSPSSGSISSGVSSIYPSPYSGMPVPMPTPGAFACTGPAMPTLPNSQYNSGGNVGVQLSYGFAPGIVPAQIPNVPRADSIDSGPKLGWNIGGVGAGGSSAPSITSVDSGVHDPIKAQQETVCQSIFVPEEDRPIYSFGFPSVSEYDESSSNDAVKPFFLKISLVIWCCGCPNSLSIFSSLRYSVVFYFVMIFGEKDSDQSRRWHFFVFKMVNTLSSMRIFYF